MKYDKDESNVNISKRIYSDNDDKIDNSTLEEKKQITEKKPILKIVLIIISILIGLFVVPISILVLSMNIVFNKIDAYKETEKSITETYNSIPEELINRKMVPSNWKYVDYAYGWSGERTNKEDRYYFYIDEENYNSYKNYWLEDVKKSEYNSGLNKDLEEYGDRVFHLINVSSLSYKSDIEYGNVHMYKNKTYYLVRIYDNAIYYKYIYEDMISSDFDYDWNNLLKEYIFYQNNGEWVIEELYRNK